MLVLGLLLNVLGLLFNLFLVTTIGVFGQSLLKSEKFRNNQHKFMGLTFFVLAIWLLASQLPAPPSM